MVQYVKSSEIIVNAGEHLANEPIVFILVGPPGAGKTTWAMKTFGWQVFDNHVVSTDYFVEQFAQQKQKTYDQVWTSAVKASEKKMYERVGSLIKNKQLVIWDQTNLTQSKRNKIINQFPKEYKKFLVMFNTHPDVLKKRLKHRSETLGKTIPDHIIKSMIESYDDPTEQHTLYDDIVIVTA